jgi:hypothetical protein
VRTAIESIAGLPQAAKMIVEDPSAALDAIAKDDERRYLSSTRPVVTVWL